MTTILATFDGSPLSRAILPVLLKMAPQLQAKVLLVTVVDRAEGTESNESELSDRGSGAGSFDPMQPPTAVEAREPRWAESTDQAIDRGFSEGRDYLMDVSRTLAEAGISVEEQVLMSDDPGSAIVDFAKGQKVDFIVMATHGRSGLREVIQGSVAGAVVRSGVAPVLLVRPSE